MPQIMDADLKTLLRQFFAQFAGDAVFAFGNEIEGGAKAQSTLKLHESAAFFEAGGTFDIMGKNQRDFFPPRPARPAVRHLSGGLIDRPRLLVKPALPPRQNPPRHHPQTPRKIWLETVINVVADHERSDKCHWPNL